MLLDGVHPRRGLTTARAALLAVLVTAAGIVAGPAPSSAHNSRTAFVGDFGPYDVVASVRDLDGPSDEQGVLLDVQVRTRDPLQPVDDADVRVAGQAAGQQLGPLPAERFGNTYRVELPGADVEAWEVEVTIDAPAGATTKDPPVPGPVAQHGAGAVVDSGDGTSRWLLPLAGVGLVAMVVVVVALGRPGSRSRSAVG